MRHSRICVAILLCAALAHPCALLAQGKQGYLNLEPPTNKALAIARVGASTYLLVANSPDDSVEIYDAATFAFVERVPVGLDPIGIRVKPTPVQGLGTLCYSINWSGDSVTVFALSSSQTGLDVRLLRTVRVGDEPTDLAFQPVVDGVPSTQPDSPFHEAIVLIHGTPGNWDIRHPVTLLPFDTEHVGMEMLSPSQLFAVKEPWAVEFVPGTPAGVQPEIAVLNKRGGNSLPYDFDVWGPADPGAIASLESAQLLGSAPRTERLGSANLAMAFADNGDLYIVGQLARNNEPNMLSVVDIRAAEMGWLTPGTVGEAAHLNMERNETGFVKSMFWRISNWGTASPIPEELDLNQMGGGPMPITQPTALAVLGDGSPGTRIFIAGFNSDTLGMLQVTASGSSAAPLANWTLTRIDASHPTEASFPSFNPQTGVMEGVMMGPRALALDDDPNDPRLFIYNRIDHSIRVLDADFTPSPSASPFVGFFGLRFNPEPDYIQDGRKFLYSSKLSANGTSSCASCHVDGDSDQLAWNLGGARDRNCGRATILPFALREPSRVDFKGPMVTQSLRGLVTFEVSEAQAAFTTEPLHWRGDKGRFTDFNAAFVNLMGLNDPNFSAPAMPCEPDLNRGITGEGMLRFQDFAFSLHYPPNPEQPLERIYSGDLGTPGSILDGRGARRGLKLFFENPVLRCSQCHMLPSGSNLQDTDRFAHLRDPAAPSNLLETAALRGLVRKEKRLSRSDGLALTARGSSPTPFPNSIANPPPLGAATGQFGLLHTGENTLAMVNALDLQVPAPFVTESIAALVHSFDFNTASADPRLNRAIRDAVTLFVRQFDTGVAPMVGVSATVDPSQLAAQARDVERELDRLELQVRQANAELAVHATVDGAMRGFWFDVTASPPIYVEEPNAAVASPGPPISRADLLNFVAMNANPDNALTFHATPLGAGRRSAWLDGGQPPPIDGVSAEPSPTLAGARPNRANLDIPSIPRNATASIRTLQEGRFVVFHTALASLAPGQFGVQPLGAQGESPHEAPRRFRVRGPNIQHGARLRLYLPSAGQAGPNPPTGPPGSANVLVEFLI